MSRVAIIDYGMCNLDSIVRAIECCGGEPTLISRHEELQDATHIVLPGVGAFPDAMSRLREQGFADALPEQVANNIPLLGICLGMQLLFTQGQEVATTPGLDLIPGKVTLLKGQPGERIPHIGWNEVDHRQDCVLFSSIKQNADFYFVHSYAVEPDDASHTVATTPYAGGFASAVQNGLVFGTQFHPEKSQNVGFALLKNFLEEV